ncbi:MAG: hydrogenase nickel incorporation protein HypB [candidate division WOR-3 bacterium]
MAEIRLMRRILTDNDSLAEEQRKQLDRARVLGINIMSAPGAGKTTLIEKTVAALKDEYRIWVIEGDIQGDLDARRVIACGVGCSQINTRGACHLDALMLSPVFASIDLRNLDLLLIENVGNLVCPAEFKLPVHYNVMLVSVPEGSDKPVKYPLMFSRSDVLILNKIDLLPYVNFDTINFKRAVRKLKPTLPIFSISLRTGKGFNKWLFWLKEKLKNYSRSKTKIPKTKN